MMPRGQGEVDAEGPKSQGDGLGVCCRWGVLRVGCAAAKTCSLTSMAICSLAMKASSSDIVGIYEAPRRET